jgi:XRE family transcriptional regulator, regulator of sulfur utilization
MKLNEVIAFNLRLLRTERNLSLGQLAEQSGVSKVMLSQMEKGESNPTINTIWKIANGLKVPYSRLIDEVKNETVVIRGADCVKQADENDAYRVYCYFPTTPARNFEIFRVELDPHCVNDSIGHAEKSQEYVYVCSGELILKTAGREYTLGAGDSICFDPTPHHVYENRRDEPLTFLVINYYK